jgi:hypothetical protein
MAHYSKMFPTMKLALAAQADLRVKKASGSLPDVTKAWKTAAELWIHFRKTSHARPASEQTRDPQLSPARRSSWEGVAAD